MNDPAQDESVARNRLLLIGLSRLSGLLMIAIGVLIVKAVIALPDIAGYVLIIVGFIEMLVLPQFLTKRWRSPKE